MKGEGELDMLAGKVELYDWNVDFASWCSYKYEFRTGNASGCFIHEKHHNNAQLPRFAGWWGHNKERRFKMEQTLIRSWCRWLANQ
jgi:kynureninase